MAQNFKILVPPALWKSQMTSQKWRSIPLKPKSEHSNLHIVTWLVSSGEYGPHPTLFGPGLRRIGSPSSQVKLFPPSAITACLPFILRTNSIGIWYSDVDHILWEPEFSTLIIGNLILLWNVISISQYHSS